MHFGLLFLASLTLSYLPFSLSYRDGARSESCYNMLVMHTSFLGRIAPPTECGNTCQYNLSVVEKVNASVLEQGTPTTYQCGETYLLRLASTSLATFEGFMVEARESDGSFEEYFEEESTIWGTWVTNPDDLYHAVECNRSLNSSEGPFENAATQSAPEDLRSLDLYWRAPPPPNSSEEYLQLPQQIRFWFVTVQQRLTYIYPVAGPTLDRDCIEPTEPPPTSEPTFGTGSGLGSASASASGSGSAFGSGPAADLDFVPFISLSDKVCLQRNLDGASKPIYITGGMPFGNSVQSRAYVGTNGIISFGLPFYFWYPSLFPTRYPWTRNTYVVAPFWSDVDIVQNGSVCYTVHEKGGGSASNELLRQISAFIGGETFDGIWMLVAQWEDVHMYPYTYISSYPQYYSKRQRDQLQATNTYQAIVITDGIQAYAVFTYDCARMETPGYYKYATIGFNARGEYYQNHPFSGLSVANNVGCNGLQWNTLVYQLHLHADFVQQKRAQCLQMYKEDEDFFGSSFIPFLISVAEPCPCSLRQAWRDWRFQSDWRNDPYCFYHRVSSLGPYCCYSFDNSVTWGSLVSTGIRTSSLLFYHPRLSPSLYRRFDKQFRETCCGVANLCGLYQERRPPNNCTGYNPPAWSWGWGDPHINTLDGRAYTFNGWGEYILANVTFLGSFQGRTSLVPGSNATQFSAFVFGYTDTRVEVNCMDTSRMCETYYNGENITDNVANVNDTYSVPFVLDIFRSTENSITTVFSVGVSINISVVAGIPNYVLTIPERYRNQSRGLLGNFNGNDTDDFVFRNGTLLRNNASDFEIHQFGQSWQLQPNESLFQYPAGQTADDYAHRDHVPVFLQDIANGADPQVVAACGGDSLCIFDAVQTGNISIGVATMNTNQDNTVAYQEATNFPPQLVGPSSFLLNAGELSIYIFNASDDGGEQVQVNIFGGLPANATLLQVNSTTRTYNFTWRLTNPNHASNLTFYASDSFGAVGVLSPEIVVCACQNGGNCTSEGMLSAQNNVFIMNCICPSAWMGPFCESDVDGCNEISCYEGVDCFDVPAPGEGAMCGPCPVGFTGDGQKCLDIDECGRLLDNCEQNCSNTVGSFECSCRPGYQTIAGASNRCEDIDECQLGIHDCQQLCTNTEGSFQCNCTVGFQTNSNGTCTVPPQLRCGQSNCSSGCIRHGGTQMCFCDRGYELDTDGQTCIDTNECERYTDICGPQQQCMNNDGGHSCICLMGYEADSNDPYGRTCQDVDECITAAVQGKLLCTGAQNQCVNQVGSYQCTCPVGTLVTSTVLRDGTVVTQCEVPVVSAEGRDNSLNAVLVGVALTEFLDEGGIDDFIGITVNVTFWYCTSNGCGQNDLISINGTSSQMTLRFTWDSFSVVVDLDSVGLNTDGDLAFSFYIRVAVAGQMYILDKNTALAAVQSGAQLYANQFGMNISFVVANPDPQPTTEEPTTEEPTTEEPTTEEPTTEEPTTEEPATTDAGLSPGIIAAIAAPPALVTLALLVLLVIGCCCCCRSRDKKAIPSDWPDQTTSQDEQKHPLTTFQGSPTTPEPPPTETKAVMITNQGYSGCTN